MAYMRNQLVFKALYFEGWLVKLWECLTSDGVLVLCTSNKQSISTLSSEIGKWLVIN